MDQPWRIMSIGLREWAHGYSSMGYGITEARSRSLLREPESSCAKGGNHRRCPARLSHPHQRGPVHFQCSLFYNHSTSSSSAVQNSTQILHSQKGGSGAPAFGAQSEA